MWSVYSGTPSQYVDMAARSVGATLPANDPLFAEDFRREVGALAAAKIPGGNLKTCVGVAIATKQ